MVPRKNASLDISLGHGQAAWVLAHGTAPDARLLGKLKYLRRRGVPFSPDDLGSGRGIGTRYRLHHVVEIATALFLDARGHRLVTTAQRLCDHRADLHRLVDQVCRDAPSAAFDAEWILSIGRQRPFLANEVYYNLSIGAGEPGDGDRTPLLPLGLGPDFASDEFRKLGWSPGDAIVPLATLAYEAAGLAKRAPDIRPGRP